jgi:hypothetical protein
MTAPTQGITDPGTRLSIGAPGQVGKRGIVLLTV